MGTGHSSGPVWAMNRRNFLRLGGAGAAGAVLLSTVGIGDVIARAGSSLRKEFEAAAKEYGVPVEVLLAVGYVNTRWEMTPPGVGEFAPGDVEGMGGYGVMRLRTTPDVDTLGQASMLTGIPARKLTSDRKSNILGGAAVIAALAGRPGEDPNAYYEALASLGDGGLFADQVFEVLSTGATATISTGETVVLAPQAGVASRSVTRSALSAGQFPGSVWYGASPYNYTAANRPYSNAINKIIIHVAQGSYSGTLNWFKNSRAQASAHYTVSSGGRVGQSVREKNIAWHAGWWSYNQTSIGIEHEGYISNPSYFTDAMYRSSAKLSAYMSRKYRIPVDRTRIIGHYQVPGCSGAGGGVGCHTDPGRYWNWDKYMSYVRYYR